MKIKSDFITNSSSTNYIFLFKGKNRKNLYSAIKDSGFLLTEDIEEKIVNNEIEYETISCDEEDLIKSLIKNRRKIKTKSIDELIEDLTIEIYKWDEYFIDKEKAKSYYVEHYFESFLRLKTVEKAKDLGFEKGIEVEYGDGGGLGIEEGTDLGKLLHREGLEIFSNDLIIINERRS